jgi:methyltransferase-like protein/SAM-dependent methyltransferase
MRTDYDDVPYPSMSYAQTHPDRLATIATLLGLQPAPVAQCRVLELGCAGGGNLIPMAYALPGSTFVGVDVSPAQIDMGNVAIARLGLRNLTLHSMDILDITPDFGQFDYILAHGVYSWVPAAVREHTMRVCSQNLAPDGIAYISYNTYPGWHMMGIIRDAMLYRTRNAGSPQERVTQARQMLDFMAATVPSENSAFSAFLNAYMRFLQGELKGVSARGDSFLLHDELEEHNEPFYFSQFAAHAAQHGLEYLAEADFASVFPKGLSQEALQTLQGMAGDTIEMEQYMDFLNSRMFRQTLLCHAGLPIQRILSLDRVDNLVVASRAQLATANPDLESISPEQFRGPDGSKLTTDHPVSKAALAHLSAIWPRGISFDELLDAARARVNVHVHAADANPNADKLDLQANLLKAYIYSSQLVELHTHAPAFTTLPSERPVASPVARLEAQAGGILTNLWHERVHLTPVRQCLVTLLDGTRDRPALVEALTAAFVAGAFTLQEGDQTIVEEAQARVLIAQELEVPLRWLARAGVLVG